MISTVQCPTPSNARELTALVYNIDVMGRWTVRMGRTRLIATIITPALGITGVAVNSSAYRWTKYVMELNNALKGMTRCFAVNNLFKFAVFRGTFGYTARLLF